MRRLLFVAMAMCAVACNRPSDDYDVYIDPAWGDQVGQVEEAVHMWQQGVADAGGTLTFHVVVEAKVCDDSCAHAITIHPAPMVWIENQPGSQTEAIGYASVRKSNDFRSVGDWSNLWVASDDTDPDFEVKRVAAHELGHAMWLSHTGPHTLMCIHYPQASPTLTCTDLQQWASLRGQTIICQGK